jgi:hypothetical protein
MPKQFTEPPLFTKTYDFLLWLSQEVVQFPRSQRFILAQRLETESHELLKRLILARLGIKKRENLIHSDGQLQMLRILLRMARDLQVISFAKYDTGIRQLEELGKLLGDWLKRTPSSA